MISLPRAAETSPTSYSVASVAESLTVLGVAAGAVVVAGAAVVVRIPPVPVVTMRSTTPQQGIRLRPTETKREPVVTTP